MIRRWLAEPAVQWLAMLTVGFGAGLLAGLSAEASLLLGAGVATGAVVGSMLRRRTS